MALRDLTTEAMIEVTSQWLDTPAQRDRLADDEALKGLVPLLEAASTGLKEADAEADSADAFDTELARLTQEADTFDDQHDRYYRGSHGLMTALAEVSDDRAEAARFIALRDTIFPDGLLGVNRTYLEQAGAAKLAEERLTDELRQLAQGVVVHRTTLGAHIDAYLLAARNLGAVQARRNELEQARADRPPRRSIHDARNRWIRVVRSLESVLLISSISDQDRSAITRPLQEAEAKAATRLGRAEPQPAPGAPNAPAEPTG